MITTAVNFLNDKQHLLENYMKQIKYTFTNYVLLFLRTLDCVHTW